MQIQIPSGLAHHLRHLPAAPRRAAVARWVEDNLDGVLRDGVARGPRGETSRVDMVLPPETTARAARVADTLNVRLAVVVEEAIRRAAIVALPVLTPGGTIVTEVVVDSERARLEEAYRRLGLDGDPRCLSVPVLQFWLENPVATDPVAVLLRELTAQVARLEGRVAELSARLDTRRVLPTNEELALMGASELRAYLQSLGGKAHQHVPRGDLLSLIREKERVLVHEAMGRQRS